MGQISRSMSLAALLLVGCGSGGGTGEGAQPQGSGAGGAGGADACAAFTDPAPQSPVTITIVNTRDASIYVDTSCSVPFTIAVDGVEHEAESLDEPGHVGYAGGVQTCASLRSGPLACCDCQTDGHEIPPGASFDVTWHGLFYDRARMPDACWASGADAAQNAGVCFQPVAAAHRRMTARARVFATFDAAVWNMVADPIPAEQDFVYGTDAAVQILVH